MIAERTTLWFAIDASPSRAKQPVLSHTASNSSLPMAVGRKASPTRIEK